jgi:lysophospholipase L1-like esterase
VEYTEVDGRSKRLVKAKGHAENRCTLIGDSIIQMIRQCLYTSIQSIPGLYAKDLVDVMRRGVVKVHNFKAIIVIIGTNDLCRSTHQEIAAFFEDIVEYIRSQNPLARLAICGILPRPCDAKSTTMQRKRTSTNNAISHLCRRQNVHYIKTELCLFDQGPEKLLYMPDKIHLSDKGWKILKMFLEGRFGSLLGLPPQWVPFPLNIN